MCPFLSDAFSKKVKATPHKDRLTSLRTPCLHLFRHLAQISLDWRQPNFTKFAQSDEKSDFAIRTQSLCGIALKNSFKAVPVTRGRTSFPLFTFNNTPLFPFCQEEASAFFFFAAFSPFDAEIYRFVSFVTTPERAIRAIIFGIAIREFTISAIVHTAATVI